MAFFSNSKCIACGREAGALAKTKLVDGNHICTNCLNELPDFFRLNCIKFITYEQLLKYKEYREENKIRLTAFNNTKTFFEKIYIDEEKGWVIFNHHKKSKKLEDLLNENPDIFELKDLVFAQTFFAVKDVKEGVFKDKMVSDVSIILAFDNEFYPCSFNDIIIKNYKMKGQHYGLFNWKTKFIDSDPEKMEFDLLISETMMNNGINIPYDLDVDFLKNPEFMFYDKYFQKLFELKNKKIIHWTKVDEFLEQITNNRKVRKLIEAKYGK